MRSTAMDWFTGGVTQPTAILADIHGNLEAFTAVLAELDKLGIRTIYSLGDTVGYGPDPEACTRLAVKRCQVRVMGNHEYALKHPDELAFNPQAQQALDWTRIQLEKANLLDLATGLEFFCKRGNHLFVHGSVRDVVFEYVMETDGNGYSAFDEVTQSLTNDFNSFTVCFVGHNHRPFLATRAPAVRGIWGRAGWPSSRGSATRCETTGKRSMAPAACASS